MMKRLVPVDKGDLRDSIGWTWGEVPAGAAQFFKSRGGDPDLTATIYAGDDKAFYARLVEFGTVKTGEHPYFFPSYHANKKRAKRRIKRAATEAAKAS
jgi:HK97 gp10 family phage protein